jgi:hypothetical protein
LAGIAEAPGDLADHASFHFESGAVHGMARDIGRFAGAHPACEKLPRQL